MGKKVPKEVTIGVLEAIVEGKADFKQWGPFKDIEIYDIDGFVPDMKDADYLKQLKARMNDRLEFVKSRDTFKGGYDKLPEDALKAIEDVVNQL